MKTLCLASRISGVAGPASFQRRLEAGLTRRGIGVTYDMEGGVFDAVLVTGATRRSRWLRQLRRRGVPILQRLDGMNWIHRRRWTGLRHFLRAEANNFLLRTTRRQLADVVIYQSEFVRTWWEGAFGPAPGASRVIRNGVPLDVFTPEGPIRPKPEGVRLVVLEGAIGGGYEIGLEWALHLANGLAGRGVGPLQVAIAGDTKKLPASFKHAGSSTDAEVAWLGEVAPELVPPLLRSGDLLFSADLHPACPNSVIEALACGLPVVAFDTGAIPEIVDERCGAVVPFGGNPWRLDPPDVAALVAGAAAVLEMGGRMRQGARRRAEQTFSLDRMVDEYLAALGWL